MGAARHVPYLRLGSSGHVDAPAPGISEIKAHSSFLLKVPPLLPALNACTPGGYYHCILERRGDLPDFVQDQPSGPLGWLLDAWSSLQVRPAAE